MVGKHFWEIENMLDGIFLLISQENLQRLYLPHYYLVCSSQCTVSSSPCKTPFLAGALGRVFTMPHHCCSMRTKSLETPVWIRFQWGGVPRFSVTAIVRMTRRPRSDKLRPQSHYQMTFITSYLRVIYGEPTPLFGYPIVIRISRLQSTNNSPS